MKYLLAILAFLSTTQAWGQAKTIPEEYGRILRASEQVEPLTDSMFGEQISLYNGTTEFSVIDIDVPGNSRIPVRVQRRYVIEDRQTPGYLGGMGEWDVDVAYLRGTFTTANGWIVDGPVPGSRCSNPGSPPPTPEVPADRFFHGISLHVPGSGDQNVLARISSTPAGPTGAVTTMATKGGWFFSCLAATKNGYGGEGFVGHSPDGLKYYFDYVISKAAGQVAPTGWWSGGVFYGAGTSSGGPMSGGLVPVQRSTVYFVVSRVEDQFGNWVNYGYTGGNLTSITSSDLRTVAISYVSGAATQASAHGTQINYTYTNGRLTDVRRPDGTYWHYSNPGYPTNYSIRANYEPAPQPTFNGCSFEFANNDGPQTFAISHPSGAVAVYTFGVRNHKRTYVPRECMATTGTPGFFKYPPWSNSYSLLSRVVSGPGMSAATTTYDYPAQSYSPWVGMCANCPSSKFIVKHEPDGRTVTYEFGIKFGVNEGQLLSTSISDASGSLLSTTINEYVANSEVTLHPFPARMGSDLNGRSDDFSSEQVRPLKATRIEQDGVTFSREISRFDIYTHPLCEKKYSSLGWVKYEITTYQPNTTNWLIDLVDTVVVGTSCEDTAPVVVDNTYNNIGSLTGFSQFGALIQTFSYNSDGTLATVSDAKSQVTTLGSWHRGVPRAIGLPTIANISVTVGDFGQILSATDENGYLTCYRYDAMFRLDRITYTSEDFAGACDTTTWTARTRTFAPVFATEYGIGPGHWKAVDYTGAGRTTTFYDGYWRPLLVLTEDTGNIASRSYVVNRYDATGQLVFRSYPVSSLVTVNDSLLGTRTTYDGLGRPKRVQQDIEGSAVANTDTAYLSGFQTQVTNPRGKVTTTSYQVYDEPSTSAPVLIQLPEGVSTSITRQATLGKPLSVTRSGSYSGATLSASRSYVYDSNQRLCQTIEPETGTTTVDYDGNGNVAWTAEGQVASGLSAASCATDRSTTPAAAKVSRTYDELNREVTRTVADGKSDVTSSYFPDGKLKSLVAKNPGGNLVTTTYSYNKRRLLIGEVLQVNTLTPWTTAYAYNANGHLSSQTYPGNMTIGYAPDGLGRPTQAGTFATGVSYYPNGAMSGFTYGNGIAHAMTQNARQLPSRSIDSYTSLGVTTKVLDDIYTYDANGNVMSLEDASNAPTADNRTWGKVAGAPTVYDGLDRLVAARSTHQWGAVNFDGHNASYIYDPLDNLRYNQLGASQLYYTYDSSNRLNQLSNGLGSAWSISSNARGDIIANALRNQNYQFDLTHRLSEVSGKESYLYDGNGRRARTLNLQTGTIEYFGYSLDGRLMQDWSNRRQVRNGYVYLGNTVVGLYEVNLTNGTVTPKYQHTDALGSPVVTTKKGTLQTDPPVVLSRMSYTPYGLPTLPMDGVGHTGHFMDVGTQLTYMQQRYYDPQIGRFLSVDPVAVREAGDNFNRYWYADNNPFRFTDPDGRETGAAFKSIYLADSGQGPQSQEAGEIGQIVEDVIVSTAIDVAMGGPSGEGVAIFSGLRAARIADKASKASKVEKSVKRETVGRFTKRTEVRPGKDPGQSRAEYVIVKDENGKVIRTYKDSYDRAGKFKGRKPLTGGPEGRPVPPPPPPPPPPPLTRKD